MGDTVDSTREQGGSIRSQNRTTLTTRVVLVALAAAALTGCSIQGNAAESWLGRSQIVDSTDMSATGCFGTCDVRVEGTISSSATEEQIRRLGEAATDYLAAQDDDFGMTLRYGEMSVQIGGTQGQTTDLLDLALEAFADERVSSGYVYRSFATLNGSKAELSTLYDDYSMPDEPTLTVRADDDATPGDGSFLVKEGSDQCDTAGSLLAEFDELLLDPTVTSVWLVLCTKLEVTVSDQSGMDAMVAHIQQLASDPTNAAMEFIVDADDGPPYSVTADTPQLDPLFALFDSTPGVAGYLVTDNVIQVGVSDPALFRSIVTTIDAAPRPDFIEQIRVGHASASVYLTGDGTVDAQIDTAESMFASNATRAADDLISFEPQPDGTLEFEPVTYDREAGEQIVDAVIAGGLWRTSSTEIEVFDQPVVFTVTAEAGSQGFEATRTNETPETTTAIEELNRYWAAQTASG